MKTFTTSFLLLFLFAAGLFGQTARVQVIHNSPSGTVDVWANDNLLLDNFTFRSATPFIDVPAGVDIVLGIAPESSTSAASSLTTFPVNLESGKTYIVTAAGLVGDLTTPFTLIINDAGREAAADPTKVDIAVLHGSTNAPAVDVDATLVANNVIAGLAYGSFTPYLSLAPDKYDFAVRAAGNPNVVASFRADLSGLGGGAAYVFASGLLGGSPAFGLYAALPNGTVLALPLTPTARVQVIHNSPEPTVDVYAGNTLLLDNFAFRTATPFVDLPADRNISLGVALSNSTGVGDVLVSFPATFAAGKTYIATASGIVGNGTTPFTLIVNDAGREAAADPTKVDIAVLHGSPNAPAVDVDATLVANNVIAGLAYGSFTPYLSLTPDKYDFAVRAAGNPNVVASFRADLSGLAGGAAYVFASGLLGGSPAFGLYAALPNGTVLALPLTPTARVQVIHNSPNPTVDVYAGNTLLLDNFAFRTATPFVDLPADRNISLGVALSNSTGVGDVLVSFPATFAAGKTYIATASGIVGNGTTPFTLIVNDAGREAAADPTKVDIAVLHGSTNAPAVDVDATLVANNVIAGLAYGSFTPYLSLAPDKYDFAVRAAGNPNVVASFRADLSGLGGGAAYVFASGLLGGSPAFGLYAALPNGTVLALPLTPTARVQVIHNSPEPTVDVYAGNTLLLDNFAFRTATPFVDLPADRNISLGVALSNSTGVGDVLVSFPATFAAGKTYIATASGIVGNGTTPFTLIVNDAGREAAADPTKVDIAVLHGSPNAPAVDVDATLVANNVIAGLAYGSFTPYLSLTPDKYDFAVRAAGNPNVVASFRADLSGLAGGAAYVFASGLLGGSPAFGLYAALPNGTVLALPLTPTARVQVIHNSPNPTVDVYAGNTLLLDNFAFRTATPFVDLPADRNISLGVALSNSTGVGDVLVSFPATFAAGKTYIATASGIVGNGTTPFTLIVNDAGREAAADPTKVDIAVLHGSPNAPAVDVDATLVANNVIAGLAYGSFTPYLSLTPDKYDFAVRAAGNPNVVASFRADLSGLGGGAAYVFASGLLGGSPAFGLYAALPNGTVLALPLTPTARVQVIHNSPNPTVDVYAGNTLLLDNFAFRTATPFVDLPADRNISLGVALSNSTGVGDVLVSFPSTFAAGKTYIATASGIVGNGTTPFTLIVNDAGREAAADPTKVDIGFWHGSTNAPEVDVQLPGGPVLFDNFSYGEFSDYLEVAPGQYVLQVTPANDNGVVVQSYSANLSALAGEAITVFASGLLSGQPAFEVWVALADGTTFPLPVFVSANELTEKVTTLNIMPNPVSEVLQVRFRLSETETLRFRIRDAAGRLSQEGDWGLVPAGEFGETLNVGMLPTGVYQLEIVSDQGFVNRKFVVQD